MPLSQGMDQSSFFVDAIDREAIKVRPMPTITTAFLVMENYIDLLFKVIIFDFVKPIF